MRSVRPRSLPADYAEAGLPPVARRPEPGDNSERPPAGESRSPAASNFRAWSWREVGRIPPAGCLRGSSEAGLAAGTGPVGGTRRLAGSTEGGTVRDRAAAGRLVAGRVAGVRLRGAGGVREVGGRRPVVAGGCSCSCAVARPRLEAAALAPVPAPAGPTLEAAIKHKIYTFYLPLFKNEESKVVRNIVGSLLVP